MIKVQNLNKTFKNHQALKNVNFEIDEKEVVTIIGPSGAGKSILLRCINALEIPDSGSIIVDNVKVNFHSNDLNLLRQKVGMVFQNFNLFAHLTVLENIILAPLKIKKIDKDSAIATARELLNMVDLSAKENFWPPQLSGGQKQRIAIARSLAMEPKYMLFDEPTSSLDPEMVNEVLEVVRNLTTKITSIIVTHEMSFVKKISNKVVFMAAGEILEITTVDDIFSNPKSDRIKTFFNRL